MTEATRGQRTEARQRDAAVDVGVQRVATIFPHGTVSEGPLADLANAYATIERNRQADTDPDTGMVAPRPMTQSVLQTAALDPSVSRMPRRPGSFRLDFNHRCDGDGEPLHIWSPIENRWVPNPKARS